MLHVTCSSSSCVGCQGCSGGAWEGWSVQLDPRALHSHRWRPDPGVGYSVPVVEGSLLEGLISLYLTSTELVAVTFLISVSHKLFSRAQCGLTTFYGDIPGGSGKSRLAVLEYSST